MTKSANHAIIKKLSRTEDKYRAKAGREDLNVGKDVLQSLEAGEKKL